MDDELMQNADVFVDSREGAMKESGDVIQSQCKVGRRLPSFFF
jgi:ornithine cyclodeaminase/alanine dehydrogenase-like protein (mu-crystallin family)